MKQKAEITRKLVNFRVDMEEFLRGEWVREQPKAMGRFPVRGLYQHTGWKYIDIVYRDGESIASQEHGGWWWSKMQPDFPDIPVETPAQDDTEELIRDLRAEAAELKKIVHHYVMVYGKEY